MRGWLRRRYCCVTRSTARWAAEQRGEDAALAMLASLACVSASASHILHASLETRSRRADSSSQAERCSVM